MRDETKNNGCLTIIIIEKEKKTYVKISGELLHNVRYNIAYLIMLMHDIKAMHF